MSSLFRKPKKRFQRRVFDADNDENGNDDAMEVDETPPPPPPPIISEKAQKEKFIPKSLLSFGDEEEEGEIFRVKKSSQSKKLQRQMDRERKNRDKMPSAMATPSNGRDAVAVTTAKSKQGDKTDNSRNNDHSIKPRSYEGLILSGRAALSAGTTGDMSASGSEDESETGNEGRKMPFSHAFRPSRDAVRAMLDRGVIPDAATIHAARKTRQKAREITGSDYIGLRKSEAEDSPLANAIPDDKPSMGGRLVREDGDGDGSDEDNDRIEVRGVIEEKRVAQTTERHRSAKERTKAGNSRRIDHGSDPDSAGEEWEAQQIRKAVTGAQIMAAQNASAYYHSGVSAYAMPPIYSDAMVPAMHPGMVPPPPPPQADLAPHLLPLLPHGETPDLGKCIEALKERIARLKTDRSASLDRLNYLRDEQSRAADVVDTSNGNTSKYNARYRLYQKLRGYFTDLLECLDEKMPLLQALEQRSIALRRKQSVFLAERRRADVRDQAQDALMLTAKPGTVKPPESEDKTRRAAEREGRRQRRRRAREVAASTAPPSKNAHRDGDSSDDEIPQSTEVHYAQIEDQIRKDALCLFSDALPSYSRLCSVLSKASHWRSKDRPAYGDAFVADCLPKLIAPYVRMELLLWNPIAGNDETDFENMSWYRLLLLYSAGLPPDKSDSLSSDSDMSVNSGVDEDDLKAVVARDSIEKLRDDPDAMILPKVIAGVVVPKLTELIEVSWEPLSKSGTTRMLSLLHSLGPGSKFPGIKSKAVPLANAVIDLIASAVANDVFVPVLPRSIIESRGGAFFNRQVNGACRLLRNCLRLQGIISDAALHRLIVAQVLDRYLLAAIRCCSPTMAADICYQLVSCLPAAWLPSGDRLQKFVECIKTVKGQLQRDNPLHMKSIDQLKSALGHLQAAKSN